MTGTTAWVSSFLERTGTIRCTTVTTAPSSDRTDASVRSASGHSHRDTVISPLALPHREEIEYDMMGNIQRLHQVIDDEVVNHVTVTIPEINRTKSAGSRITPFPRNMPILHTKSTRTGTDICTMRTVMRLRTCRAVFIIRVSTNLISLTAFSSARAGILP